MTPFGFFLAYVVGPAIVTLGTIGAAHLRAKSDRRVAQVAAEPDNEAVTVDGYHKLVADLQAEVERLRKDHDSLRSDYNELRRHVQDLEQRAQRDKSLIQGLTDYVRVLRDEILRMEGEIPSPPGNLSGTAWEYLRTAVSEDQKNG